MLFTKILSALAGAVTLVHGQYNTGKGIRPNPSNGHWVDAWASMPQLTEPANLPPAPFVRIYQSDHGVSADQNCRTKAAQSLSIPLFDKPYT
jgi:hypothetical protein